MFLIDMPTSVTKLLFYILKNVLYTTLRRTKIKQSTRYDTLQNILIVDVYVTFLVTLQFCTIF